MNLRFLGDALDHWKGSIFESLQNGGVLQDFAVDPMVSDHTDWQPEDFALFVRLLRVEQRQLISHKFPLADRIAYFREIGHTGDLFLDPDTGIATGRPSIEHVAPSEAARLLESSERLLLVYQHVRAVRVCDRVDAVCAAIRRLAPGVNWCSYESGTVAMIFLSLQAARVDSVQCHFNGVLGRHAAGRIRRSKREV